MCWSKLSRVAALGDSIQNYSKIDAASNRANSDGTVDLSPAWAANFVM